MRKRIGFILIILCGMAMTGGGCSAKPDSSAASSDPAASKTAGSEAVTERMEGVIAPYGPTSGAPPAGEVTSGGVTVGRPSDGRTTTTAAAGANATAEGALTVTGSKLTDSGGQPVQLRGVSSHGLSWFPQYVNEEALRQQRDEWGCSVFRLAMYTADYNGYCTGDEANRTALKARVDEAVGAAERLGMYIIIDWHILSDGNPLIHRDQAVAFFRETAEKYAGKTHILYEICNEPNGGTSWSDIKKYAEAVMPVIRAHTDAVVLVGTPAWSQEVDKAAADPLRGYQNIMYTLHFYAATHKDDLRGRMTAAADAGLPLFVSEFGVCDASGNGAIDEAEADRWLEAMNRYGISYVMWNLSNKDESSAMIKPDCQKVSGFQVSELSRAGAWFVDRNSRK